MPDYEHHVFVSYRHSDDEWVRWTKENFVRALRSLLRIRLGAVSVYHDDQIEVGEEWPSHLARNLARSRLLVAILSRDYFMSEWCRLELAMMHERQRLERLRDVTWSEGLILPVVLDDGECFPAEVKAMCPLSLHKFANPFMTQNSPSQEALAETLKEKLCPAIERALAAVPTFDPSWEQITQAGFKTQFQITATTQKTLPAMRRLT